MTRPKPEVRRLRLLVFSSLFPTPAQPGAGLFIRNRMFRLLPVMDLVVVAPQAWFPGQGLIRLFRPHYRVPAPRFEIQQGVEIHRPRFLSIPGLCKWADGRLMALGARRTVAKLVRRLGVDLIDAHFLYPDGAAATDLGERFGLPVTITLRGTESRLARDPAIRPHLQRTVHRATRLFAVAGALKAVAEELGAPAGKTEVIGNGVDSDVFRPGDRATARDRLGLPPDAPVLISVGTLVERKGFHRVFECLPGLRQRFPGLQYLVVGGPGVEGDFSGELQRQVHENGLDGCVQFLGPRSHSELPAVLAAADVFVLATGNEGWANVFLEAMSCGLPVVTTDVGGNREVVSDERLGTVVPFGDAAQLETALAEALARPWDRDYIRDHAIANDWNVRIERLHQALSEVIDASGREAVATKVAVGGPA